ncbi:hypothetical protein PCE1_003018 [Barthelona sp. PCE]
MNFYILLNHFIWALEYVFLAIFFLTFFWSMFATVKRVTSADTFVVVDKKTNNEITLTTTHIQVPKPPHRMREGEPFGFAARELVRSKLVGSTIKYVVRERSENGRIFADVYLPGDVLLAQRLLSAGFAQLRTIKNRVGDTVSPTYQSLVSAQQQAKAQGVGIWSGEDNTTIDFDPEFVDVMGVINAYEDSPCKCVVEHVISASFMRILVRDPRKTNLHLVQIAVNLSGVRLADKRTHEELNQRSFALTNDLLLQREGVTITFNHIEEQKERVFGYLKRNTNDFQALLLERGYAVVADWSLPFIPNMSKSLRAAETQARKKQAGLWIGKEFVENDARHFKAVVREIASGGIIFVEPVDAETPTRMRINFANIRAPRIRTRTFKGEAMSWEAKEFMRKELIGKTVDVVVEWESQREEGPSMYHGYVLYKNRNPAVEMVRLGYAFVIRGKAHVARTACFDELHIAEQEAKREVRGVHMNEMDRPHYRYTDLTTKNANIQQQSHKDRLQKAGRIEAIVDRTYNSTRFRVMIPSLDCLITFGLVGGRFPGDPTSEHLNIIDKYLLQRDGVQITIDEMDARGCFYGNMWFNGNNVLVEMMEMSLAELVMAPSADTQHLFDRQNELKELKQGIWEHYEPTEEAVIPTEPVELSVTYISSESTFYAHYGELTGEQKDFLISIGTIDPISVEGVVIGEEVIIDHYRHGLCRATVEGVDVDDATVRLMDFGLEVTENVDLLFELPEEYSSQHVKPMAHNYSLAFVESKEDVDEAEIIETLKGQLEDRIVKCLLLSQSRAIVYSTSKENIEQTINANLVYNRMCSVVSFKKIKKEDTRTKSAYREFSELFA